MPFSRQGPAMFGLKQCNLNKFYNDGKGTTAFGVGKDGETDPDPEGGGGCVRWTIDHKENPDDPLPEWKDEKCWYDDKTSNTGQFSYSCGQCGLLTGLGPAAWSWQKGADAPACGKFANGDCIKKSIGNDKCTTEDRTENNSGVKFPQGRYNYYQICPNPPIGCGKDGKNYFGNTVNWTDNVESEKNRGDTCLDVTGGSLVDQALHGGRTLHCGRCTDNQRSAWYEQGEIPGNHPSCFAGPPNENVTIPSAYQGKEYTGQNKKSEPSFENNDMIPFCPSDLSEGIYGPMDEALDEGKKRGWWGCAAWGVGTKCQRISDGKVFRCKECGNTRKAWEVFNDPVKHGCYETDTFEWDKTDKSGGPFPGTDPEEDDRAGPLGFGVSKCPISEPNSNNFNEGCDQKGWGNGERCCKNAMCTSYTHCRQCPNGTLRWVFDGSRGKKRNPEGAVEGPTRVHPQGIHVDMCRSVQCAEPSRAAGNCGGIRRCADYNGPIYSMSGNGETQSASRAAGKGVGGCNQLAEQNASCQTDDGALFRCMRCTNDRWAWHEDGNNANNGCFDRVSSGDELLSQYGVMACPSDNSWGCGSYTVDVTKCDSYKDGAYTGKNTYICRKCLNGKEAWTGDDGQFKNGCYSDFPGDSGFGMPKCPEDLRCDGSGQRCWKGKDYVYNCEKCSDWSGGGWAFHRDGWAFDNGCKK